LPIIATAAKLFTGSKGGLRWIASRLCWMAALVVNDEEIMRSARPSGGALATKAAPMAPVAPARFSTTTGLPSDSLRRFAMARAKMSFDPPGGEVTMNWSGRSGNASAEKAAQTASSRRRGFNRIRP
jgi:hypothetical protein